MKLKTIGKHIFYIFTGLLILIGGAFLLLGIVVGVQAVVKFVFTPHFLHIAGWVVGIMWWSVMLGFGSYMIGRDLFERD